MSLWPSYQDWSSLADAAKLDIAQEIERSLGGLVHFDCLAVEDGHAIASFTGLDGRFVFVPGGSVQLGFDGTSWQPSDLEQESFRDSASEFGISEPIQTFVDTCTTPPRAYLAPSLLVSTEADEVGWKRADPRDHPHVARALQENGPNATIYDQHGILRIRRDKDGVKIAEVGAGALNRATIESALADKGCRVPLSDEWEWLCGAGAQTLFRWGDHCECDRYPTDKSSAEAKWRREWALSGGRLSNPSDAFEWEITMHRAANRHGIRIAFNPYRYEVVKEGVRGGDGGGSICGGVGFFLGWLPLATAYHASIGEQSDLPLGFTFVRRVIDI